MTRRAIIRRGLMVLLFGGLGLGTSVAVAWGATVHFMAMGPLRDLYYYKVIRTPVVLVMSNERKVMTADDPSPPQWRAYTQNEMPAWSRLNSPPEIDQRTIFELAAGWPLVCLSYTARGESTQPTYISNDSAHVIDGWLKTSSLNTDWRDVTRLPGRPLLVNLLLDVLAWGLIWLVLLNIHRIWRLNNWLKRRWRSRCVWCGYDLSHLEGERCPECGNAHSAPPRVFEFHSSAPAVLVLGVILLIEAAFLIMFTADRIAEPIHRAAWQGDLEAVLAELADGADIEARAAETNFVDSTPLLVAASVGYVDIVDALVQRGADVNAAKNDWFRAIDLAILKGDLAMIEILLDAGAEIQTTKPRQYSPVQNALFRGNLEVIRLLVERGHDLALKNNAMGLSILESAVIGENDDLVRYLLDLGFDPNSGDPLSGGVLRHAVRRKNLELMNTLLKAGAKPTFGDLLAVVNEGTLDDLKLLVEHGGDVTTVHQNYGSLLHAVGQRRYRLSTESNYREFWTYLVEQGANVNALSNGRTILMDYAYRGDGIFMEFLLEHGADPALKDAEGKTARDHAQAFNQLKNYDDAIRMWKASEEGAESGTRK